MECRFFLFFCSQPLRSSSHFFFAVQNMTSFLMQTMIQQATEQSHPSAQHLLHDEPSASSSSALTRTHAFERKWQSKACNTDALLSQARAEARVAYENAPEHTAAECAQWRAMFQPSSLLTRSKDDIRFPDVAVFRYSHQAFEMLARCVKRVQAKTVSPEVAARAMECVRENKSAIELISAADLHTEGHELLIFTKDLTKTPRLATQGNIVMIDDHDRDLDRLRTICRTLRPDRTAFVRILPHICVYAQPWAGIAASAPISFFHVHLVDTGTYKLGERDIPL